MLFGADHGLVSWTPIAGVALVGLVLLWRRDRRLAAGLLAVFAAMLYIVAAHVTHEQSSFGNRFFVTFTPGFVVGTAVVAGWALARWRTAAVGGLVAVMVVWNLLFAFQWAWGLIPKRGPVAWEQVLRQQFTTAPRELARALTLFWTDRGELIARVQQVDLERLEEGRG